MNILLDTHIFLWAIAEPSRLSQAQISELETASNRVYVSAVSITEIMIKASLGKFVVTFDPVEIAEKSGFELLSFGASDALPLATLPFHHRDPFDRMLIAQSLVRNLPMMTNDSKFSAYDVKLI